MWKLYVKYYDKLMKKAKKYAIKKFVKSDYLKETTSILPLTLLTIITRAVFNFLITSRLKTDVYLLDFTFSLFITVFFSLYSPFLYNLFNKNIKEEVDDFSKYIIESFWREGWIFFEYWKVRILGTSGVLIIFILFFIEINSRMIQEFIFHIMISSAIVDYITNIKIEKDAPKVTVLDKNIMIESYFPEQEKKQIMNDAMINELMIINDYDKDFVAYKD